MLDAKHTERYQIHNSYSRVTDGRSWMTSWSRIATGPVFGGPKSRHWGNYKACGHLEKFNWMCTIQEITVYTGWHI